MSTPSRLQSSSYHKKPYNHHTVSYNQQSLNQNHQSAQPSHSDYQLVIQFQLRRQRQKNRILEQRIHNKQIFIQQMKEYQEELTLAFQKCQEQLMAVRNNAQNFIKLERDYLQQIADLKHLVIRLQDQINLRDKEVYRRHYSSVKESQQVSPLKNKQQRAKTLMNNQNSPMIVSQSSLQKQVINEVKKISKFLTQFLMMTQCFETEAKSGSLKHRLKIAWKWIKNVVKQWNELKKQCQTTDEFIRRAHKKLKYKNQSFSGNQNNSQYFNAILKAIK